MCDRCSQSQIWLTLGLAAKRNQLWAELAKGPLPTSQTLLLDYITSFQVVAFWRAVRLRHVNVASTILNIYTHQSVHSHFDRSLNLEIIPNQSTPYLILPQLLMEAEG